MSFCLREGYHLGGAETSETPRGLFKRHATVQQVKWLWVKTDFGNLSWGDAYPTVAGFSCAHPCLEVPDAPKTLEGSQ